jgi:hypothetical protein
MVKTAERRRDPEDELQEHVARFVFDPLGFVLFAFPWGETGTTLEHETGPDEWQAKVLSDIGAGIRSDGISGALQIAARSGHGVGKSALIAWLIIWFMSTRPNPQIPVTANTKEQLTSKTWRELAKWHRMAINSHWFTWTATKFYYNNYPETWFATAIPWSKERSEAFAGTHERFVLMIFDEASAIDDSIWEVAEGAMTTPGAIWVVFGNPTRNTGRFFECFNRLRGRWRTYEIDSRTAKMTDKEQISKWEDDYGEDSDFFRVRVKGQEPRAGFRQFIGTETAEIASKRVLHPDVYRNAPIVLGCDVADYGDDLSTIYVRQGRATLELQKHRPRSMDQQWTMTFADLIAQCFEKHGADKIFVDANGLGLGVADRLIQMGYPVFKVYPGAAATNDREYFNKRVEMWGAMRDWLADGAIPGDADLKKDLTGPEYGFSAKGQFQLEKKSDMKDRGLASPDCGDALAYTFASPVYQKAREIRQATQRAKTDYDPLTYGLEPQRREYDPLQL